MKAEHDPLWLRLRSFAFDAPGVHLTFTQRLAREQGWPLARAQQVVEEYRRFLFLAQRAGHPVTPSDAVDQAWHLHLVYTRSYWVDLCGQVLQAPLHHDPTQGGTQEDAKYEDWYERTRTSYGEWFGTAPPIEFWPPPEIRFRRWPDTSLLRRQWATFPAVMRWLIAAIALVLGGLGLSACTALEDENARGNWLAWVVLPGILIALWMAYRSSGGGGTKCGGGCSYGGSGCSSGGGSGGDGGGCGGGGD